MRPFPKNESSRASRSMGNCGPMCSHRLAVFLVVASLPTLNLLGQAEASRNPKDFLSQQTLAEWEFISAIQTPVADVCIPRADGVLAIAGKPVGYLATKSLHENYELHYEWRWPADAAKSSNSGVLLHISSSPASGTPWPVSFQMQLKPDHAGDMLPMDSARFAEKLTTAPDVKPPLVERRTASSEKPPGEWNVGDIVCKGDSIDVHLNGVLQNHVSGCIPAVGKIGFQLEGAPFELRNVTLSPLK